VGRIAAGIAGGAGAPPQPQRTVAREIARMPASGFIDFLPRVLFPAIWEPFLLDGRATFD
jgi:hypothetical protein